MVCERERISKFTQRCYFEKNKADKGLESVCMGGGVYVFRSSARSSPTLWVGDIWAETDWNEYNDCVECEDSIQALSKDSVQSP